MIRIKLAYLLPLVVAGMGAGVGLYCTGIESGPEVESERDRLQTGRDYYVQVTLVELAGSPPDKSKWDRLGSAPDIYVEIEWRENIVFKSSVKSDTLIGVWSQSELDLQRLAMGETSISPDDLIQGARVSVGEGEKITLRVFDYDPVGASDLAGEKEVVLEQLSPGKNTLGGVSPGLRRIEILLSPIVRGNSE